MINQRGTGMQRDLIRPEGEPVNDDRLLPDENHVGEDDDDPAL